MENVATPSARIIRKASVSSSTGGGRGIGAPPLSRGGRQVLRRADRSPPHHPSMRPLLLRSAQSACSREKAKRPSVKRKRLCSSSWTYVELPQPIFLNSVSRL